MLVRPPFGCAILLLGLVPGAAMAQAPSGPTAGPAPTREVRLQLAGAVNNAGLQHAVEVSWRWPTGASSRPLRAGAHRAVGLVNVLTPSTNRLGAWVQWAPLSVASIRLGAEPTVYFGTFHSVQTFSGYDAPFDVDTRKARGGRAASGLRAYATPVLQVRVRAIAIRSSAELEWWRVGIAGPVYYEPARDTLLAARGDTLVNMSNAATFLRTRPDGRSSSAGVLHQLTRVFDAPQNRIQRLGVVGVHEFAARPLGLPHLAVTAAAWRYLDDPSKRGQWGGSAAFAVRFVR